MRNKVISITEARKEIFKITDEVQRPNTVYTLTVEGAPRAVLLSKEEYDSIMETMELLSEPDFLKDVRESQKAFKRGEYYTWEEIKQELDMAREPGFVVCDHKVKYNEKKSKKSIKPRKRKV